MEWGEWVKDTGLGPRERTPYDLIQSREGMYMAEITETVLQTGDEIPESMLDEMTNGKGEAGDEQ